MGPINWLAVGIAALLGALVLWGFLRGKHGAAIYALQIVPAAMLGHALARIGPEKLAMKPQLYFMQSGGLAAAIVIPALWIAQRASGVPARESWRASAAFLAAYLVMGAVFWAMGFR
ncbi:MAG: DUF1761 domain-containing protein [Novosphingobium sp.]